MTNSNDTGYSTHTLNNTEWYVVVYSPRGFRNELAQRAFMKRENAERFVAEVENDVDSWVATGEMRERAVGYISREDDVLCVWAASEQYAE